VRFLLLGINFAPEIISTAVYTTGLAEWLVARGHEVHVVTAKPYFPAWRVFDGWRGWYRKRELSSGLTVVHCPLYVPSHPTGKKRILHHASFGMAALPAMLTAGLRQKPDVVFVVAPSLLAAPVGVLTARLSGAKSWLHIQDFEVEAAFATGLVKEDSALGRLAKRFEGRILKKFNKISTISRPMLDRLSAKGVPKDKIVEMRNWANLAVVQPLEGPSPLRDVFGIKTPNVVLYAGNIANKQGLEILPYVSRLLAHRRDISIVICGDGPFLAELQILCEGLENVMFFPLQPIERLSDLMGLATVHFLPQIAGAADLVLPSKLTNMLASGRPVIATADAGTALADAVEGCGIVAPPGDVEAISRAIEHIVDHPEDAARFGAAARASALESWSIDTILEQFEAEALELAGSEGIEQAIAADS
jgi:colanic acid biosynthesis glycosyl transferase WcaI